MVASQILAIAFGCSVVLCTCLADVKVSTGLEYGSRGAMKKCDVKGMAHVVEELAEGVVSTVTSIMSSAEGTAYSVYKCISKGKGINTIIQCLEATMVTEFKEVWNICADLVDETFSSLEYLGQLVKACF